MPLADTTFSEVSAKSTAARKPVLCFSHVRWSGGSQRPRHLLSRCASDRPVVVFEEPVFDGSAPVLELTNTEHGVTVAIPHLPPNTSAYQAEAAQRRMVDRLVRDLGDPQPVLWYYTPMALGFTNHVRASVVVYDCMDELARVDGAPAELAQRERLLLERADVVFTDGHSLYEHKRRTARHRNIHAFPSCVDLAHFGQARVDDTVEPADQAEIAYPRVGFFGVIDERTDLALLANLAEARPDLQFVMVGPIVNIDGATLPQSPNLHWLGAKPYDQLPAYLAGWDVAMLPFARNDATRFISPSKTPECLAAGKPVVSTSIADVVVPYAREGLVWLGDDAGEFSAAIDDALASDREARLAHADDFLSERSWRRTWDEMWALVEQAMATRSKRFRTPAIAHTWTTGTPLTQVAAQVAAKAQR